MSIAFQKVAAISSLYNIYFDVFREDLTEYIPFSMVFVWKNCEKNLLWVRKVVREKAGNTREIGGLPLFLNVEKKLFGVKKWVNK